MVFIAYSTSLSHSSYTGFSAFFLLALDVHAAFKCRALQFFYILLVRDYKFLEVSRISMTFIQLVTVVKLYKDSLHIVSAKGFLLFHPISFD